MFTGLPKLADKAFVIGFLVPILMALGATLALFRELAPVVAVGQSLSGAEDLTKLTLAGGGVIVAALLLLLANQPIYRALEGYVGPLATWPFKRRARGAWVALEATRSRLADAFAAAEPGEAKKAANKAYRRHLRDFRQRYPRTANLVLPTRFGNANRAFETYAANAFDVEAIQVWPRLSAILPDGLQDVLTDARAQVNCFANITVLFSLIAAARLLLWAIEAALLIWSGTKIPAVALAPTDLTVAGASLLLLLSLAVLAYEMAVERVIALGVQVRVAFDLHLLRLPAKLGYRLPLAKDDRDKFWAALEKAWDFQNPPEGFTPVPPVDQAAPGSKSAADGDDDAD